MATSKLKAKDPKDVAPGKIKMMIFGKSGIGKTWISLDFPKPYYIDAEGGARLAHYQAKLAAVGGSYFGVEDGALSFEEVLGQIQALATEKHEFKTLVIGSITKLFQTAIAEESQRILESGNKDEYGASKKGPIRLMRRLVNWINRIDMNVVFEAHEMAEWGLVNNVREQIGTQADTWDKLIYELDLTLQVIKQGPSRYALIRKSRLMGFPETEKFPLEYAEFAKRYGKDFIEGEVKQINLATPEQIAELISWFDTLGVRDEEKQKVLDKAKAETIEELTVEQADAYLAFLKAKVEKRRADAKKL
jgi:hypothetical protein